MIHELKIRKQFADAIVENRKTFEVRVNDRGFNAGDLVRFTVVDEKKQKVNHPINKRTYEITYVLSGHHGISDGFVVFGIAYVIPIDKMADCLGFLDFLKKGGVV